MCVCVWCVCMCVWVGVCKCVRGRILGMGVMAKEKSGTIQHRGPTFPANDDDDDDVFWQVSRTRTKTTAAIPHTTTINNEAVKQ